MSDNYKAFVAGDKVWFTNTKGTEHDAGIVVNPEPNADGRILVEWTSGVATWARLECLLPFGTLS